MSASSLAIRLSIKEGAGAPTSIGAIVTSPSRRKIAGADVVRLYRTVYSQLSAYVHGSEWSRRRQIQYSQKHYDRNAVLVDISTVVRSALVVWEYWARFCDEQLGWMLSRILPGIAAKLGACPRNSHLTGG